MQEQQNVPEKRHSKALHKDHPTNVAHEIKSNIPFTSEEALLGMNDNIFVCVTKTTNLGLWVLRCSHYDCCLSIFTGRYSEAH